MFTFWFIHCWHPIYSHQTTLNMLKLILKRGACKHWAYQYPRSPTRWALSRNQVSESHENALHLTTHQCYAKFQISNQCDALLLRNLSRKCVTVGRPHAPTKWAYPETRWAKAMKMHFTLQLANVMLNSKYQINVMHCCWENYHPLITVILFSDK